MTTNPIPLSVIRDLCETVPGFAERVTVKKVYRGENIAPRQSSARKGIVLPFADILRGSSTRDLGDPPPPVLLAPAAVTRPTDAQLQRQTPEKWSPQSTTTLGARGANSPKAPPAASRSASILTPETFKEMGAHIAEHIDASIQSRERAYREQLALESFNSKRSAFNRLTATKSDGKPSGSGSAWNLRNIGGALAASALGLTTRKSADRLPATSGLRPMTGASLKG